MRQVTFPHMGHSFLAFKMLMEDLGNQVIIPPRPSKKTLNLGVKYAPEFACLPFKILLGTYLETLEKGMDTIVTSGGDGPCRAGHYAHLHQKILASLNHKVDLVCFENPKKHPLNFISNIYKLNSTRLSYKGVKDAFNRSWHKLKALDKMEQLSHQIRPREINKGQSTKTYHQVLHWLDQSCTYKDINDAEASGITAFKNISQDPQRQVLKIGLIGEIYVVMEPACNLEIEETLGHMGVEVHRSMYLTNWTKDNLGNKTDELLSSINAAKKYLPIEIGGHARDNIGHTVLYSKQGYDGVIQLAPFTCIPEIVARTILPKVSKDLEIPIMTFFLDEQTGKAGMVTRLEAFVDLLKRKHQLKLTTASN